MLCNWKHALPCQKNGDVATKTLCSVDSTESIGTKLVSLVLCYYQRGHLDAGQHIEVICLISLSI